MEKDEPIFNQEKYAKIHFLLMIVFWIYSLVHLVNEYTTEKKYIFIFVTGLFLVEILLTFVFLTVPMKILQHIRYVQLIIISYLFMLTIGDAIALLFGLNLGLFMLEFILLSDITDQYTRNLKFLLTTLPGIVLLIVNLLVEQECHESMFNMIAVLAGFYILIWKMSDLLAELVINYDRKFFEQRRLAEQARKAIDAVNEQQEKVKKTNEELGIQKIKLEIAYNKINRVNTETHIQNIVLKYILSSLEIDTLMDLITEAIQESSGLVLSAIVLQPRTCGRKEITYKVRTNLGEHSKKVFSEFILSNGFQEYIMKKEMYVDNYVQMNQYPFICKRELESLLIVPLILDIEPIGALICGHSRSDFFGENTDFFQNIVSQLVIAIHNASMYARMEQMAKRDSLTGIYNRGHMNTLLDSYSKNAVQKNYPLSAVLIDIDNFKRINDTYGHLFGDEVIKKIAEFADTTATKESGIAARYGGEEFVMILPKKDENASSVVVEEMRRKICEMEMVCDGEPVKVCVSIGISSYPNTCKRVQELLGCADTAMYFSKKTGRNRITIDSEEVREYVKDTKCEEI